jgi:hypothetical protein
MQSPTETDFQLHLRCIVSFPKLDTRVPQGSTEQLSRKKLRVSIPKRACAEWIGRVDPGEPIVVDIPLPKSVEFGPRMMRCRGNLLRWSLESDSTFLLGIDISQIAIRPDVQRMSAVARHARRGAAGGASR